MKIEIKIYILLVFHILNKNMCYINYNVNIKCTSSSLWFIIAVKIIISNYRFDFTS